MLVWFFMGQVKTLYILCLRSLFSALVLYYRAMCLIDFHKPVPHDEPEVPKPEKGHLANGVSFSSKKTMLQNGGSDGSEKNFVLVPFKDPVLFVGHVADSSILVVEKPWLDAINQLPPPVYRHLYGT